MRNQILIKKKNELTRLTGNERKVLRMLLDNSRISDVEIGQRLKASSQAASKIRKKLEKIEVIDRYIAELDYSSLGLEVFSIALFECKEDQQYEDFLSHISKNVLSLYKVIKDDVSHIAFLGFKSLYEMDELFHDVNRSYNGTIKIKKLFTFPIQGLIKHSKKDLFNLLIKEFGKEKLPSLPDMKPFFADKPVESKKRLNPNEKMVLAELIGNSRISYKKISRRLNDSDITSRGISKIKERLENKNIVKNYSLELGLEKLGAKIVTFLFVKGGKDPSSLHDNLKYLSAKSPNIIGCYRLNEGALNLIVLCFRSIEELEHYHTLLQSRKELSFEIEKTFITSPKGIINDNPSELFKSLLT